ncbi:MAG: hypothetical protein PHH35_00830 [Candidatus Pacebacteria bacterium]|nr:hypothetical protein [Candidatus Paceibacterota bacterium]
MLKNHLERNILRNRPYFGGLESDQVRNIPDLNHCDEGECILTFNIHSGVGGLFKVISCPFKGQDGYWRIFLEEQGPYCRVHDIQVRLDEYSVVCYPNLEWEKEWCFLKTSITAFKELKKLRIHREDYLPVYY